VSRGKGEKGGRGGWVDTMRKFGKREKNDQGMMIIIVFDDNKAIIYNPDEI
jgi:hypothetical protein